MYIFKCRRDYLSSCHLRSCTVGERSLYFKRTMRHIVQLRKRIHTYIHTYIHTHAKSHTHTHIYACGVMVTVAENGHGDPNSILIVLLFSFHVAVICLGKA